MKKKYFKIYAVVFAVTMSAGVDIAQAASIPGLFNTGVNNDGLVISQGSLEQHYTMTGDSYQSYVIGTAGAWVSPPVDASWIAPTSETIDDPVATYIYTTTFDLTGFDSTTASITGMWATDNDAVIFLNGNNTGNSKDIYGYTSLDPFSISTGFVSGLNVLEFRVNNSFSNFDNPTALLLTEVEGVVSAIPLPAAIWLFGSGLMGIFGLSRHSKGTA